MENIKTILTQMQALVDHPDQVVEDYQKNRKRPVIGCLPEYCPEEIVYAAGMLPIGMWGAKTDITHANIYFPAFACSLVQNALELGMRGAYDKISAVIIPSHCDHLKCLGQDWKAAVPQVHCIPLVHPNNRRIEGAVSYLKSEYARIRHEMEIIGDQPVSEAALADAIGVYNTWRQTMREFARLARDYPHTINPKVRHLIIKSAYFMDKAEHTKLVNALMNELKKQPAETWDGKKVVLTGIMAEPDAFLDLFTENGLTIAADDLAQESRQFRVDVPAEGTDALERLARRWNLMSGCPLLIDPEKPRRHMLVDLARESGADGVVACMMKFCDPEEFDFPFYKQTLEEADIPLLHLEMEPTGKSLEQARTRIQGFAEMLDMR